MLCYAGQNDDSFPDIKEPGESSHGSEGVLLKTWELFTSETFHYLFQTMIGHGYLKTVKWGCLRRHSCTCTHACLCTHGGGEHNNVFQNTF